MSKWDGRGNNPDVKNCFDVSAKWLVTSRISTRVFSPCMGKSHTSKDLNVYNSPIKRF